MVSEETVPRNLTSISTPEEVLAFWLIHGAKGDIDQTGPIIAPDAPWVGFGSSADDFVEGSDPFNSFDIQVVCSSDANVASCEMTWNDEWIAAIPTLRSGAVRVQAEVVEGVIVAFHQFGVSGDFGAAFDEHLALLESEHSDRFEDVCAADASSRECSELMVATVTTWVETQ